MVGRYRKKSSAIIEVVQFNGSNHNQLADWSAEAVGFADTLDKLEIRTLEGIMTASIGDFVVKGTEGEFYFIRKDIFEKNYEKVD